jgi:hypothetical protein
MTFAPLTRFSRLVDQRRDQGPRGAEIESQTGVKPAKPNLKNQLSELAIQSTIAFGLLLSFLWTCGIVWLLMKIVGLV